jgi:hypothetical protein
MAFTVQSNYVPYLTIFYPFRAIKVRTLYTGATLFYQTNYMVPDIGLAVIENYFSGE